MKKLKIFISLVLCLGLVGCASDKKEANKIIQEYQNEVVAMATEKGYTIEELNALEVGQQTDKEYDNAVLERFGKVQVFVYHITGSWNDGFIEGAIPTDRIEVSDLSFDNFTNEELNNYYDDYRHFNDNSAALLYGLILDYTYTTNDEGEKEMYWQSDLGQYGTSGYIKSSMNEDWVIKANSNRLFKEAIFVNEDEDSILKYPMLIEE